MRNIRDMNGGDDDDESNKRCDDNMRDMGSLLFVKDCLQHNIKSEPKTPSLSYRYLEHLSFIY